MIQFFALFVFLSLFGETVFIFSFHCIRIGVMQEKMNVTLSGGRNSSVLFASDIKDLSAKLGSYGNNVMWVFDENSARLFKGLPERRIILEPGEQNKTMKNLEAIISRALSFGMARDSRFIGFGGGVVCDMTALAASLYMRGCQLTLVPTTLLAMVDASLGGKTAIDFEGGKNLIGSFYPASDVIISIDTLRTLPDKEFKCGLGEVLKHAFLSDDISLFKYLLEHRDAILRKDKEELTDLIELSLDVKRKYLEADPEETKGIRSFLNFGHTFAHALESSALFSVSHGEAVAWGIGRALDAGVLAGITPPELRDQGMELLKLYGYDTEMRVGRGDWLDFAEAMKKDKKKYAGKVQFVLVEDIGKPVLHPLESEIIQASAIQSVRYNV